MVTNSGETVEQANQQLASKLHAAQYAASQVADQMILGLGSGSTAMLFIEALGKRLKTGELQQLHAVATSEKTAALAKQFGIPLLSAEECPTLDLAVDGADEVDRQFRLIKGRGGALLREKIVAYQARELMVVVDETKIVDKLGHTGPLPVEVTTFAWKAHARWLEALGCQPNLRLEKGQPFLTENQNYTLDCTFPDGIADCEKWNHELQMRPGIVEHGLFLNLATAVVVGTATGYRLLERITTS